MGRSPRHLWDQWWPSRSPTAEHDVRLAAHPHDRPAKRSGAHRDPRLFRGRPEPVHARDERLGRAGTAVVAQPPGTSRRHHRPTGWLPTHQSASRNRRRTGTTVGRNATPGAEPGWICRTPTARDRGGRLRATRGVLTTDREPCDWAISLFRRRDSVSYAWLTKQKQYSSKPPEPSPGARKCSLSTMWL